MFLRLAHAGGSLTGTTSYIVRLFPAYARRASMLADILGVNVDLRPHALRGTPHVRHKHSVGNKNVVVWVSVYSIPRVDIYKHKSSRQWTSALCYLAGNAFA